MERRDFMRSCGYACIGGVAIATILQSCKSTKMVSGTIQETDLVIDLADFEYMKKKAIQYRSHIIAQNDQLKFPIAIFRHSTDSFSALYMQCTHQGAELQVFGDKLHCPAHGSEFSNTGQVEQGPADIHLRTFPIRSESGQLKISLK